MPVSSGSFTVGGVGADYATWEAAFADIIDGILIGNLTFTQTGLTTETGTAVIPANFDCSTFILTCTSDLPHRGNFLTQSRLIDINHAGDGFDFTSQKVGARIQYKINDLYLKRTIAGVTGQTALIKLEIPLENFKLALTTFNRLLLDGNSLQGTGYRVDPTVVGLSSLIHTLNCIAVDCNNFGYKIEQPPLAKIQHCIANKCGTGFDFTSSHAVTEAQGNGSFASTVVDFVGTSTTFGQANASSDGSADDANWSVGSVENKININTLNEFISTSKSASEFYRIKPTSNLIRNGNSFTPVSEAFLDIAERIRPAKIWNVVTGLFDNEISIGAHEFGSLLVDQIEAAEVPIASLVMGVSAQSDLGMSDVDVRNIKIPRNIPQTVGLSQVASVKQTAVLTAQSDIDIIDGASLIGDDVCILDTTVERNAVNLWFPITTLANRLILPRPEFSDIYSLDTRVTPRNTRGGDLRVYKAGGVITRLQMSFIIDRPKRDLAIDFFSLSTSKEVRLLDWENRIWRGVIINTPIDFTSQGKTTQSEDFAFDLTFEAVERLN